MSELISLSGRVAIVTGAGRGLGRAYARALAERGAAVVVNDLGVDADGHGQDASVAEAVAAEIQASGGRALADQSDVAGADGGRDLVTRALEAFGRLDVVVANAGICGSQPFSEATLDDFEHYWRIHLAGHVNVLKPAWPILTAQGYGRVVMTESAAGLFGLAGQATYSAAKGAIHGLMRTLALEGRPHGVLVNSINPGGFSRMHEAAIKDPGMLAWTREAMPPDKVAPAVVWLSSSACQVAGQVISAWGGRFARVGLGAGDGFFDPTATPEAIAENAATIASLTGFSEPDDALGEVSDWVARHPGAIR